MFWGRVFCFFFFYSGVFTCKAGRETWRFLEEILTDHHPMETSGAEVKMDFRLLLDLMWSDPYEKVTQS